MLGRWSRRRPLSGLFRQPRAVWLSSNATQRVVSLQDLLANKKDSWHMALTWWPENAWRDALGPAFRQDHSELAKYLQQDGPSSHFHLLRRHPSLAPHVLGLLVDSTKAFPYVDPLHRDMDIIKVLRQMSLAIGKDEMMRAAKKVIHQNCVNPKAATSVPCLFRSYCASIDSISASQLHDVLLHLVDHRLMPQILELIRFATLNRTPIDVWTRIFRVFLQPDFDRGSVTVNEVMKAFFAHFEAWPFNVTSTMTQELLRAAAEHGEHDTAIECYDWIKARPSIRITSIMSGYMMTLVRPVEGNPHGDMERFKQYYADAIASRGTEQDSALIAMAVNSAAGMRDLQFLRQILHDIDWKLLDCGMINVAMDAFVASPEPQDHVLFADLVDFLVDSKDESLAPNRRTLMLALRAAGSEPIASGRSPSAEVTALQQIGPFVASTVSKMSAVDDLAHVGHIAVVDVLNDSDVKTARRVRDAVRAASAFDRSMWQRMLAALVHNKDTFKDAMEWLLVCADDGITLKDGVYLSWFTRAMQIPKSTFQAINVLQQWLREPKRSTPTDQAFQLAIVACCKADNEETARSVWNLMAEHGVTPTAIATSAMLNLYDRNGHDVAEFFRTELLERHPTAVTLPVLQSALFLSTQGERQNQTFVRSLLELLEDVPPAQWNKKIYRKALMCCANDAVMTDVGLAFIEMFLANKLPFLPDSNCLFDSLRLARRQSTELQYTLLHAYSERNEWPTLVMYTLMLESQLYIKAPTSQANMILDMMEAQNVKMDVKFATVYALLLSQNHNLDELVRLYAVLMTDGPTPDDVFFKTVFAKVVKETDIDRGFDLMGSMLTIKHCAGVYLGLIHVGLEKGLVERVCNVVIQMECDGFAVDSTTILQVINAVTSSREMEKVVSILAQMLADSREKAFDPEVFAVLGRQIARFGCANKMSLKYIQSQADAQGCPMVLA
ncbi:hypothetical protein Ae201684P_014388 [Aphanomyces euteiches]|nr:hypothetical protein Ae201684P_014388 [Aphanomyces euteiches]